MRKVNENREVSVSSRGQVCFVRHETRRLGCYPLELKSSVQSYPNIKIQIAESVQMANEYAKQFLEVVKLSRVKNKLVFKLESRFTTAKKWFGIRI